MILTCPSCSARYLLATDAIGEAGRTVRCGKCQHIWQQEPVHDSLDELSKSDFTETTQEAMAQLDNESIPDAVRPLADFPAYKAAKPPSAQILQKILTRLPWITGVAMAVAVFAILASVIISARATLIEKIPALHPVFVALGLEETATEKTLVFDSITAKIEKGTLNVTGSLINLSSGLVALPPLAVEALDAEGRVISTYPAELTEKDLKGEQSMDLSFSYKDVPEQAQQVRVKFATEADGAATTTDAEGADNTPAHSEGGSDHSTAHE